MSKGQGKSLTAWAKHFSGLYGTRNSIFITSLERNICFLLYSTRLLSEVVRKHPEPTKINKALVGKRLADSIGWTFSLANRIDNLPLSEAMAFKWADKGCRYCGAEPCICVENRPFLKSKFLVKEWIKHPSNKWTLNDWQKITEKKYGARNREAGIFVCLNRLTSEIAEVAAIVAEIESEEKLSTASLRAAFFAEEIADIFSWIFTIGNVLGINVEDEVILRYGKHCPVCKLNPCNCGRLTNEGGEIHAVTK